MFSKKLRALAFFLMALMVFYVLPVNCLQDVVSALSSDETASSNEEVEASADKEIYVLGEDLSKREESAKHFRMSDGSYVAVQYAEPVHYLDENGEYTEYDNTLTIAPSTSGGLIGNIQSGSLTTGNVTAINGFKANKSDVSITLANSTSQSALTSISKGEYSVSIIPLSLNTSSKVVVNNTTSKPTLVGKPTIEEASKLYNHTSSVKYESLFNGADLEYVLSGSKLKENIIVNKKASNYVYSFNLNLTGLYATLNEDGSISLIGNNTDKVEFTIPAGYMFDAAGNYSEGVTYTLASKPSGNYTLTVTADSDWINAPDRVFPVTVDPTLMYTEAQITLRQYEIGSSFSYNSSPNSIGERAGFEFILFAKINTLPTMSKSAHISEASFKLDIFDTSGDLSVGAYKVCNDWSNITNASSLNSSIDSELISWNHLDDNFFGTKTWNITDVTREWFNNAANYGICLRGMDFSDSYTQFYNTTHNIDGALPTILIKYTDMDGLEDYWTYTTHSGLGFGTAGVNLASGALTLSVDTLSTTDYIMPYMPTLTYNSANAGVSYVSGNSNVPYKYSTSGYGFKWSMSETIVEKSINTTNGNMATYYIFSDSDGTEHAFTEDLEREKIVDEDGLGLVLTASSSEYTITYPDKTVKTFTKKSDNSYFVAGGLLKTIKDKYGNEIRFNINTYGGVGTISFHPGGSAVSTSQLKITHNNNCKVNLVLNQFTQEAYIFYYSSSQTGGTLSTNGSGYLRKIVRAHYEGTSSSPSWSDYMTGATTSGFVDDDIYLLTYSGGYLKTISDINMDKQYEFTTSGKKTTAVIEKATLSSLTTGQKTTYEYKNEYTKIRTSGKDDIHGNTDDIISTYIFDTTGRMKNVYSYKADNKEIYGGVGYTYENEGGENSTLSGIKNNVKSFSSANANETNYLLNGDFAKSTMVNNAGGTSWVLSNASIYGSTSVNTNYAAICVNNSTGNIKQRVNLSPGKYTVSFESWKSTPSSSSKYTVKVKVNVGSETPEEETITVRSEKITQALSFEVTATSKTTITISATRTGGSSAEHLCVDNVMLTANSTSANYSLVQNGNFEKNHYNSGLTLQDVSPYLWGADSENSSISFANYGSDLPLGRSLKLSGNMYRSLEATQQLYSYQEANPNSFDIKVSGYALGTNQVYSKDSTFALRIDVHYSEGPVVKHYVNFEPNIENEWQFASQTLNIGSEYSVIKSIKIACEYSFQPGIAYFDNVSVSIVPDESYKREERYKNDKSAPEYELLRLSINGKYKTFYEYNDNKDVIKKAIIKGTHGETYHYTYNGVKLVKEERYKFTGNYNYTGIPQEEDGEFLPEQSIDKTLLSETSYFYNDYGQVYKTIYTEISYENGIMSPNKPIISMNEYVTTTGSKIFGALKETTDTLGNTTKYFYDESNGLLLAEVYSDGTGLGYEYDSSGRLILTIPVTYNTTSAEPTQVTTEEVVHYSYYTSGNLRAISTNSTLYTFTYDVFGNADTVKVGNNILVDYTYNSNNGKLNTLTYGNGTKVEYVYDSLDRVKEICYTELGGTKNPAYEYHYTNEGYLKRFDNNIEGTSTIYSYDGSGKLINKLECSKDEAETYFYTQHSYDEFNRPFTDSITILPSISEYGALSANYTLTNEYSYDLTGRLIGVSYSNNNASVNGNISLTYDNIDRITSKNVSFTGFSQDIIYTYEEGEVTTDANTNDTTSTRIKTYQSIIDDTTKTYTYNYDKFGNITDIQLVCSKSDNSNIQVYDYAYEYDDQGQITRFISYGMTDGYTYDKSGNITYRYEDRMNSEGTYTEYNYIYSDSQWGDKLTAFGKPDEEVEIEYDEVGNPKKYYDGKEFTWEQGRRLATVDLGYATFTYKYNDDGIRTSKDEDGILHRYTLNGSQIVSESWGDTIVIYLYDESGVPIGMQIKITGASFETYYFETNMFGDVVAVYDYDGTKLISYTYNAFGEFEITRHATNVKRAEYNRLLYRGYYYDTETGFYYLNSRYYDPVTCRFINADIPDILLASPMALTDKNLFAYCDNNPVIREDNGGEFWNFVIGGVAGAIVGGVSAALLGTDITAGIVSGALSGAISGAAVDIAIATGGVGLVALAGVTLASGAGGAASSYVNQRMNGKTHDEVDWGTVAIDGAWGVVGGLFSFGTADVGGKMCKSLAENLALKGKAFWSQVGSDFATTFIITAGTWLNGSKMNLLRR